MNKLRNNRGETLVESLVSILIAVLAFGILATSVVTAEKINAKTRNTNVMFQYAATSQNSPTVTLTGKALTAKKRLRPGVALRKQRLLLLQLR
ncbi:MAG: hypothetical protein V8R21_09835 [Dysosmobacter sp.]